MFVMGILVVLGMLFMSCDDNKNNNSTNPNNNNNTGNITAPESRFPVVVSEPGRKSPKIHSVD